MNIIKKWFSKKSKVEIQQPKTTTRLFSLYGESDLIEQLRIKINEIENTLNNLPEIPDLPDLSKYAVKNADNNFTTSQTIQGHLNSLGLYKNGSSQNIVQVKNQSEKHANVLFEQPKTGYRNHCFFNITHKYSNSADVRLFSIITKNTGEGTFLFCENNKLTFENDTTIDNIATPTTDKQAATKKYVDDKVASIPSVDLSNVVKTNESANLEGQLYFFGNEQGVVGFAGKAQYSNESYEPTENNEFANKGYVDSEINRNLNIRNNFSPYIYKIENISLRPFKKDLGDSLYLYLLHPNNRVLLSLGVQYQQKQIFYKVTALTLQRDDLCVGTVVSQGDAVVAPGGTLTVGFNGETSAISTFDLHPGAVGYFDANVKVLVEIFLKGD